MAIWASSARELVPSFFHDVVLVELNRLAADAELLRDLLDGYAIGQSRKYLLLSFARGFSPSCRSCGTTRGKDISGRPLGQAHPGPAQPLLLHHAQRAWVSMMY
jgi:hypothetical protein